MSLTHSPARVGGEFSQFSETSEITKVNETNPLPLTGRYHHERIPLPVVYCLRRSQATKNFFLGN